MSKQAENTINGVKIKPRNMGNAVLEAKDVRKSFIIGDNTIEIIKGVNVTINKGEFIILFGPSGCGKSTLLNMFFGLEAPTTGSISFLGYDIYSVDEDTRTQIRKEGLSLIYQQQNWIKSLDVIDNVAFPLALRGVPLTERLDRAFESLRKVGMAKSAYQKPGELSSGQQQKVSFARALVSKPEVLVADEPTGNLDSKSGDELMAMFKEYNLEGNTLIMVTHDLKYLDYATRAINMLDGVVVGEYHSGDKELDKFKVGQHG